MRKFVCAILILTLALALSGCGLIDWIFPDKTPDPPGDDGYEDPGTDENGSRVRKSVLYVTGHDGNYVLPISFDIPWEEGLLRPSSALGGGGPAQRFLTTTGASRLCSPRDFCPGMTVKDGLAGGFQSPVAADS